MLGASEPFQGTSPCVRQRGRASTSRGGHCASTSALKGRSERPLLGAGGGSRCAIPPRVVPSLLLGLDVSSRDHAVPSSAMNINQSVHANPLPPSLKGRSERPLLGGRGGSRCAIPPPRVVASRLLGLDVSSRDHAVPSSAMNKRKRPCQNLLRPPCLLRTPLRTPADAHPPSSVQLAACCSVRALT